MSVDTVISVIYSTQPNPLSTGGRCSSITVVRECSCVCVCARASGVRACACVRVRVRVCDSADVVQQDTTGQTECAAWRVDEEPGKKTEKMKSSDSTGNNPN